MRSPTTRIAVSALLAAAAAACAAPGEAPTATVIDTAPLLLRADDDALDDLTILVAYVDGDADLGGGIAEIHDCRAETLVTRLAIPPIASEEAIAAGVPIEGELELRLTDVAAIAPDATPPAACAALGVRGAPSATSATFCVVLVDAAGHRGEGDCTPEVAIE